MLLYRVLDIMRLVLLFGRLGGIGFVLLGCCSGIGFGLFIGGRAGVVCS